MGNRKILTTLADVIPPTINWAMKIGPTNIWVNYSEPVEPASATNAGNYSLSPVTTINSATMLDAQTAVLNVSPLQIGSNYTLTVNNVRDLATIPNTIATNSQVSFTAYELTPLNIGDTNAPVVATQVSNGVDIVSSGTDVGGYSDQFRFDFTPRSGDFDVQVRVQGMSPSDLWAKAGLMARESLDPNTRFAGVFATPSIGGTFFESRDNRGSTAVLSGSFPVNYPYTWLRLRRAGNVFTGYAGVDGQSWVQLGSITIAVNPIYLGFATTSHASGQATTAQLRDYSNVTNAVVGQVSLPFERLGPSSRRTPLVITEIMYKPAPRLDGKRLDFVEVFNSNPYFEDISGFSLAGDISYVFPAGTILQGGGFLVVALAPADIQSVYGIQNVVGPFTGSVKKTGVIQLIDKWNSPLLEVPYANLPPWPVGADGTGHSLVLARPSYGEASPKAWAISDLAGGSPGGYDGFRPTPLRNVMINEIMANSSSNLLDYVELYNHSSVAVDLSFCFLTDDPILNKFVIPPGTMIPAGGHVVFDETQLGFALSASGGLLFFRTPDGNQTIDALSYEAQSYGASFGRYPDGASEFYRLSARTPGAANTNIWIGDIVINELMYKPISGNDDDQFVELYNKGATPVDLGGWKFTAGINFTFPSNTMIAADGYLVVARNKTNLFARYPNLNTGNTVGDYTGKLSHNGDRVALAMPEMHSATNALGVVQTKIISVVADEVTYAEGGRWGDWASAGGSSMELIDPNSNHRLAFNWAESDEYNKSSWTNLEFTGVMDGGSSYNSAPVDFVQLGMMDVGECLVDNVEVRYGGPSGPNYIANSDFESGLTGWALQGSAMRSSWETNSGYNSTKSLHFRSSERMFVGFNSAQGSLSNTSLAANNTVTLRLKARWLRGNQELLMRLRGNWLEVSGAMPIPTNLGSPGQHNSRAVANAGPAIYEIKHAPPIPIAGQPLVVTARFHDFNGFAPSLLYRIDTNVNATPSYSSIPMVDDGTGGDAIANDGLYTATIPAQNGGTVVAFIVQAQDLLGATTVFPKDLKDNSGLPRECVVSFGDVVASGSFGQYHIYLSQNWINRWAAIGGMGNENSDATFVDGGGRIIYNMAGRFAGSPYHQYTGSPVTTVGGMRFEMPGDEKMLGTTSFNKQHVPGNGPLDDDTMQREQTSFHMARIMGLPWQNRRFYALYVNGNRHGPLMEDTQVPGTDMVKQHWPNDSNGFLYKLVGWFECDATAQANGYVNFTMPSWCVLGKFTTLVNGVTQYKLARYRWMYYWRQSPDLLNNYTNVFALIDAANTPTNSPDYYAKMEALVDTENWMRTSVMEHATGDWDSFFTQNQWNMYLYKPLMGKWAAIKWDWNITMGSGSGPWSSDGSQLFNVGANDPVMATFQTYPPYKRAYLRGLKELVQVGLNNAVLDPVLDAKYKSFVDNGIPTYFGGLANPSALKLWIATMRNSILTALTNQGSATNTTLTLSTNNTIFAISNVVTLSGTAPVEVKSIKVNGISYPLLWSTPFAWTLRLPVSANTNVLSLQGYDLYGNALTGLSNTATVVYTNQIPAPQERLVINEIMYNPLVPNAEYIEIFNSTTNFTFDLSKWQIHGVGYTFPDATVMPPRTFLTLAKDRVAFAAAYGAASIYDVYPANLSASGETLRLTRPVAGPGGTNVDEIVAQLRYEARAPWPLNADGKGSSLQMVDPSFDESRVANWSDSTGWRFFSYTGSNQTAGAAAFFLSPSAAGEMYIDDLKLVTGRVPGVGKNFLTNGNFEGPFLTNNNGPWFIAGTFGTNSAIATNVVHSGTASLHMLFTGGSSANKIQQSLQAPGAGFLTLSFWYLPVTGISNLTCYLSSSFRPTPLIRNTYATPGTDNSVTSSLPTLPPIWLNEVQAENINGPTDSNGQQDPWIELYNSSTTNVDLTGWYLSGSYSNLNQWAFPSNTIIEPGQYLVVWVDGQPEQTVGTTNLHTNFRLTPTSGSVALSAWINDTYVVYDYLNYDNLPPGFSYGASPDGQAIQRQQFYYFTPGASNNPTTTPLLVFINEWMADNKNTLANPASLPTLVYDDWFELYNATPYTVDLAGYYLAPTVTNKSPSKIPAGYAIPPHGHLLVWADGTSRNNLVASPDLHVAFKLSKGGDSIALFDANSNVVDYVKFGPQTTDITMGRCPDGSTNIVTLPAPSPRVANSCEANVPPVLSLLTDKSVFPGQTLTFTATGTDADVPAQTLTYSLDPGAPTGASINTNSGVFVWTPTLAQAPSTNPITVRVTDSGLPPLSAHQTMTITVLGLPNLSTVTQTGNLLNLAWPAVQGKVYQIQYRNALSPASPWTPLGDNITGTGGSASASINMTNAQTFYRLVIIQ